MQAPVQESWVVRLYRSFCNSIYGRFAFLYDLTSTVVSLGQWSRWRCLSFDFIQGKKVLELGFGTGVLQEELVKRGFDTYGLEYSIDMHDITSKRLNRMNLKSKRVQADGMSCPFGDEKFDSIVATFPEQYIAQEQTLRECHRLLQKDGVFVIIGRWIELKSSFLQTCFPVFYRRVTEEEYATLEQRFKKAQLSFEVVEVDMGWVRHKVILGKRLT